MKQFKYCNPEPPALQKAKGSYDIEQLYILQLTKLTH